MVLEKAKVSLNEISQKIPYIKQKKIFTSLLSFLAYYTFIVDFYNRNIETIMSVKELLLLKYIDMIKDIIDNLNVYDVSLTQQNQILNTFTTINSKLYATINTIKENGEMNLNIDLKTIQDLIRSDF